MYFVLFYSSKDTPVQFRGKYLLLIDLLLDINLSTNLNAKYHSTFSTSGFCLLNVPSCPQWWRMRYSDTLVLGQVLKKSR